MPQIGKFAKLLDDLIVEASELVSKAERLLIKGRYGDYIRDGKALKKYANRLILFKSMAGESVAPWSENLNHSGYDHSLREVEMNLAALTTIQAAIKEGLLSRYEDLIIADTFADLTEQANYLLSSNYFLAAGVIYRAVLEERLRGLCKRNGCTPTKSKATINDFNQSLYTSNPPVYDRSMMLGVSALASIGNDAAHNKAELKKTDIERLKTGLEDFLARFSV